MNKQEQPNISFKNYSIELLEGMLQENRSQKEKDLISRELQTEGRQIELMIRARINEETRKIKREYSFLEDKIVPPYLKSTSQSDQREANLRKKGVVSKYKLILEFLARQVLDRKNAKITEAFKPEWRTSFPKRPLYELPLTPFLYKNLGEDHGTTFREVLNRLLNDQYLTLEAKEFLLEKSAEVDSIVRTDPPEFQLTHAELEKIATIKKGGAKKRFVKKGEDITLELPNNVKRRSSEADLLAMLKQNRTEGEKAAIEKELARIRKGSDKKKGAPEEIPSTQNKKPHYVFIDGAWVIKKPAEVSSSPADIKSVDVLPGVRMSSKTNSPRGSESKDSIPLQAPKNKPALDQNLSTSPLANPENLSQEIQEVLGGGKIPEFTIKPEVAETNTADTPMPQPDTANQQNPSSEKSVGVAPATNVKRSGAIEGLKKQGQGLILASGMAIDRFRKNVKEGILASSEDTHLTQKPTTILEKIEKLDPSLKKELLQKLTITISNVEEMLDTANTVDDTKKHALLDEAQDLIQEIADLSLTPNEKDIFEILVDRLYRIEEEEILSTSTNNSMSLPNDVDHLNTSVENTPTLLEKIEGLVPSQEKELLKKLTFTISELEASLDNPNARNKQHEQVLVDQARYYINLMTGKPSLLGTTDIFQTLTDRLAELETEIKLNPAPNSTPEKNPLLSKDQFEALTKDVTSSGKEKIKGVVGNLQDRFDLVSEASKELGNKTLDVAAGMADSTLKGAGGIAKRYINATSGIFSGMAQKEVLPDDTDSNQRQQPNIAPHSEIHIPTDTPQPDVKEPEESSSPELENSLESEEVQTPTLLTNLESLSERDPDTKKLRELYGLLTALEQRYYIGEREVQLQRAKKLVEELKREFMIDTAANEVFTELLTKFSELTSDKGNVDSQTTQSTKVNPLMYPEVLKTSPIGTSGQNLEGNFPKQDRETKEDTLARIARLRELVLSVENDGVPTFISINLRRIAAENGVVIDPSDTPQKVIEKLKYIYSHYMGENPSPDLAIEELPTEEIAQESEPVVVPEEKITSPKKQSLEGKTGLEKFAQEVKGETSLEGVVELLVSKEYRDLMFGSGDRATSGKELGQKILDKIVRAKEGSQVDPYFFTQEISLAEKIHKLLKASKLSWKKVKSPYGIGSSFEKIDSGIKDEATVKAIESTIQKATDEANPGMWRRIKDWTMKHKKTAFGGAAGTALTATFLPKLFALFFSGAVEQKDPHLDNNLENRPQTTQYESAPDKNTVRNSETNSTQATGKTVVDPQTGEKLTVKNPSTTKEARSGIPAQTEENVRPVEEGGAVSGIPTEGEENVQPMPLDNAGSESTPTNPEPIFVPTFEKEGATALKEKPETFRSVDEMKNWFSQDKEKLATLERVLHFADGQAEKSRDGTINRRALWWETMLMLPIKEVLPNKGNLFPRDFTTRYRAYHVDNFDRNAVQELPDLREGTLFSTGKVSAFDTWYKSQITPLVTRLQPQLNETELKKLEDKTQSLGEYLTEVVYLAEKYNIPFNGLRQLTELEKQDVQNFTPTVIESENPAPLFVPLPEQNTFEKSGLTENTSWAEYALESATLENVGNSGYRTSKIEWLNGPYQNMIEEYWNTQSDMKINHRGYTYRELQYLQGQFEELQKRAESLGTQGVGLLFKSSNDLSQVERVLADIKTQLSAFGTTQ